MGKLFSFLFKTRCIYSLLFLRLIHSCKRACNSNNNPFHLSGTQAYSNNNYSISRGHNQRKSSATSLTSHNPSKMSRSFSVGLFLLAVFHSTSAFSPILSSLKSTATRLSSSATSPDEATAKKNILSLSLEKPLGMILEEVEEGAPQGVFVMELAEDGSAAAAPEKDAIVGSTLAKVMGEDVTILGFDDVMEKIINAPSPVDLELLVEAAEPADTEAAETADDTEVEEDTGFALGTVVTVVVQRDGELDLSIEAKVGDNLRKTLLDNQVEVYRGFKAKIGNCGGGGQCGFCAVEFMDSEGWAPRSDYEANKIKNSPNSRLSCLNNIQGPVTVKM